MPADDVRDFGAFAISPGSALSSIPGLPRSPLGKQVFWEAIDWCGGFKDGCRSYFSLRVFSEADSSSLGAALALNVLGAARLQLEGLGATGLRHGIELQGSVMIWSLKARYGFSNHRPNSQRLEEWTAGKIISKAWMFAGLIQDKPYRRVATDFSVRCCDRGEREERRSP